MLYIENPGDLKAYGIEDKYQEPETPEQIELLNELAPLSKDFVRISRDNRNITEFKRMSGLVLGSFIAGNAAIFPASKWIAEQKHEITQKHSNDISENWAFAPLGLFLAAAVTIAWVRGHTRSAIFNKGKKLSEEYRDSRQVDFEIGNGLIARHAEEFVTGKQSEKIKINSYRYQI